MISDAPIELIVTTFQTRLARCQSSAACWSLMRASFADLGFPHVSYGGLFAPHHRADLQRETLYQSHFPEDFIAHYDQAQHVRHDVAVQWAFRFDEAVSWLHLRTKTTQTPRQAEVWRDGIGFGVRNGISLPLRFGREASPGGLFLSATGLDDAGWEALNRTQGRAVVVMSHAFHEAMQRFPLFSDRVNPFDKVVQLSERERECLLWAARGCQVGEVADCLGVADRTVEHHLGSARRRLAARTTAQAVARAMGLGLLYDGIASPALPALWESAISDEPLAV
ncbi:LuxR family transcriptional regulator [Pararhodospirillum photometricum]|uniref:Transcriptional regulator, LuxR family n=1 Tax=Pararhodospirillum photometricum DSM 122 TaxID=1150469 RepID=H6SQ31_PARPM|nr:LuxR family transcriptional regulator [Pararhodospirillum photometricum]CCG07301.1 Transcriptional regulator, LuxR family [Pararhodospirillum photometricum DSM 122]